LFAFCSVAFYAQKNEVDSSLYLKKAITGKISPKSIVHNGHGVFFAQNMMYRHTVTIYNRSFELVKTLKDQVSPNKFGFDEYKSSVKGGPVECAFSHDGKYAWVSNYNMTGGSSEQFNNPGCDNCSSSSKYDSSFVYKVDAYTHDILAIVKVGAVPKYIACSPDDSKVVVTNWSSGDVSIIDVVKNKEVKRIKVGTFPRGIVIDSKSEFAYITVMGSTKIAKINLNDYTSSFLNDVGKGPRQLCISPDDNWLYLTLNSENKLAKINLATYDVKKVRVGHQPRSMTISGDGKFLYVVNYNDNTFSKIRTIDLKTIAISPTKKKPIGITYDDQSKQVWVACYSGYIQIFQDSLVKSKMKYETDAEQESLQLLTAASKANVANLSAQKDSILTTQDTVPEQLTAQVIEDRKFIAIRNTYQVSWKKFDIEKFKKTDVIDEVAIVDHNKVPPETKVPIKDNMNQGIVLNASQKCLVIVGGFSASKNADKKIKQLAKVGIKGEKLFNPDKNLTYVFVYSSNTRADAESWVSANLPDDIESWVKVQV
jgi:YVTN family beta-propeller protein